MQTERLIRRLDEQALVVRLLFGVDLASSGSETFTVLYYAPRGEFNVRERKKPRPLLGARQHMQCHQKLGTWVLMLEAPGTSSESECPALSSQES